MGATRYPLGATVPLTDLEIRNAKPKAKDAVLVDYRDYH